MERKNSREGILNSISLGNKTQTTTTNGQGDNKGEFDDLISALRTGDVFGEDIAKFKRSKRRPVTPSGQESRRHSAHREDSRERHQAIESFTLSLVSQCTRISLYISSVNLPELFLKNYIFPMIFEDFNQSIYEDKILAI